VSPQPDVRRVTVCELPDDRAAFSMAWGQLVAHVRAERSGVVVLPEMPFAPWLAASPAFSPREWDAATHAHQAWTARLHELAPAAVLASRPVTRAGRRLNEGFAWTVDGGLVAIHDKRYLPDEAGFWEAQWYAPGDGAFDAHDLAGLRVGMMICTDMWALHHAIEYGKAGVQLIAVPRSTGRPTVEKWLTGGRVVAIVAGAFCVSSNWVAVGDGGDFGGGGWIVDPDGVPIARTSAAQPFHTVAIDTAVADDAKRTYPRYALG
jgi:N-carbamoylputrescine amidase